MENYIGKDPHLVLEHDSKIGVAAKANFKRPVLCCDCAYDLFCKPDKRKYFMALENALEWNTPFGQCPCFEASCCCPQYDFIQKMYYDRGYWDKMNMCWGTGCLKGNGYFIANNRQYVCCCSDVGECCNGFCEGCYYTSMCGDRVRFVRYETCCYCCSIYAGWSTNYCGLVGLKDGQPTGFPEGVALCLEPGTGEQLAESINAARAKWMARVGEVTV